jgi:hypothetical protein
VINLTGAIAVNAPIGVCLVVPFELGALEGGEAFVGREH